MKKSKQNTTFYNIAINNDLSTGYHNMVFTASNNDTNIKHSILIPTFNNHIVGKNSHKTISKKYPKMKKIKGTKNRKLYMDMFIDSNYKNVNVNVSDKHGYKSITITTPQHKHKIIMPPIGSSILQQKTQDFIKSKYRNVEDVYKQNSKVKILVVKSSHK